MLEHPERKRVIERIFHAALKEKFAQFARKYDPQVVFKVWAEVMAYPIDRGYFSKWEWKPWMTITEALECLDGCCDSIETLIQGRLKKER